MFTGRKQRGFSSFSPAQRWVGIWGRGGGVSLKVEVFFGTFYAFIRESTVETRGERQREWRAIKVSDIVVNSRAPQAFHLIKKGPLAFDQQDEAVFMQQTLEHIWQYVPFSALIRTSKVTAGPDPARCCNAIEECTVCINVAMIQNEAAVQSSKWILSAASKRYTILSLCSRQIRPSTEVPHVLSQNEATSFLSWTSFKRQRIRLSSHSVSIKQHQTHLVIAASPREEALPRAGRALSESQHALQLRKCVCMEFLKVLVFHATICLSAGFSLFNQSNMKPGDLVPLEIYILWGFWEVTARLSRAPLKTKAVWGSLKGFFWDFEASCLRSTPAW